MTTTTTTTTETPPLTAQLVALLNLLSAGAGGGVLRLRAWSRGGYGFEQLVLPAAPRAYLPPGLLAWLEAGDLAITIGAPVRQADREALLRLGVLVARFDVPAVFDRYAGHGPDPEAHAAVAARLAGFPLAPTAVLDGVTETAALWALAAPLALDAAAGVARARALHRQLAWRLEASTEPIRITTPSRHVGQARTATFEADDPAGWFLPVPGGVVRNLSEQRTHVVTAPVMEPGRIYTLTDIERALAQEDPR